MIVSACSGSAPDRPAAQVISPSTVTIEVDQGPDPSPPPSTVDGPVSTGSTVAAEPLDLVVDVLGPEEVVFDWSEDRCADAMRPDLPARAVRRFDGSIAVSMSDPSNFLLVGPTFDALSPTCPAVLESERSLDPADYHHLEWFGALWADGSTIHAIVHNEFHGDEAARADWVRDARYDPASAGWSMFGRSIDGEFPMDRTESGWRAGDSLCSIEFWGMHPDTWCEPVLRWTAPDAGEFTLWLDVGDANAGGGDGVTVRVVAAGATIWTTDIDDGGEPVSVELPVDLAPGEGVEIVVDSRSDASFDATSVAAQITSGGRLCAGQGVACHQVSLTAARSDDGGLTWAAEPSPGHLVAAIAERYQPDAGFVAMWQPSNIVRHPDDGLLYMLVQRDEHRGGVDAQGTCLLRTDDIADPAAWRAWDGEGFTVAFVDPYTTVVDDPGAYGCVSVVQAPVGGLSYHEGLGVFVAVTALVVDGVSGNYLRTSSDLIRWGEPVLVNEAEFVWTGDGEAPYDAYATLLDPSSDSRNFDRIGSTPYVYFSRFNSLDPRDYDLIRVPIRLSAA